MANSSSLPRTPIQSGSKRSNVYVLYTGGTFGMAPLSPESEAPLRTLALSDLRSTLPDPQQIATGLQITFDTFAQPLDSSSMQPADWLTIAIRIAENYDAFDGFVVIHGTDTLAYTASALSFMFENLAKPVVVTGSQVPLLASPSDAAANYIQALQIAGAQACANVLIPEVVVVFGGKVMRGNRTRKVSTSDWAAFDTPNYGLLGDFDEQLTVFGDRLLQHREQGQTFYLNRVLETGIIDIVLHPGLDPKHIELLAGQDDIRGIVLRTFGAGNAPETPAFLEVLRNTVKVSDKVAVAITQCLNGSVEMGRYGASVALRDCGFVPGFDMTPEAALTKLMTTLGRCDGDKARLLMQSDLKGELTSKMPAS